MTANLFEELCSGKSATVRIWTGTDFLVTSWSEISRRAMGIAGGLRALGVGPGTILATVLTNTPEAVSGLLGAWLAGAAVASLPIPSRGQDLHLYAGELAALRERIESPILVSEKGLTDGLATLLGSAPWARSWEELDGALPGGPNPPEADDVAFVQFSSGSTGTPKGCVLTTRAIAAQLEIIGRLVEVVPGSDGVVSWLPLSHDMGVFGCLLFAWRFDAELTLSTPERFLTAPRSWFSDAARFGSTLSAGPPSALALAARAERREAGTGELRMRSCVIGAERIEWSTLQAATAAFAPRGLRAQTWLPSYGLAEATLAATAVAVSQEPSRIYVDGPALAEGLAQLSTAEDPSATAMVSVGTPCPGVGVRFAGPPGEVSELLLRSPSLATGYLKDPEWTARRFREGELRTGDLAFAVDGHVYIAGRSDDLLSVAGRNVYANEIEAAVDRLDGVRKGCSTIVDTAADGVQGSNLVLLLELREEAANVRDLAAAAALAATTTAGVSLSECVFLKRGALPKTPSGKIQRFRCRQLLASDLLEPLARLPV
jgi:acyl-CoA synthetase (AMP-forming)/AMP-acid ligase II